MATISERIIEGLSIRGMKQSELVEKTGIGKSSISTYISGAYEPKQRNIYKIAKALNVSESWLMGYDVSTERKGTDYSNEEIDCKFPDTDWFVRGNSEVTMEELNLLDLYRQLNDIGRKKAIDNLKDLTMISQYKYTNNILLNAAHEIPGATTQDKAHDDAIMDDENF